MKNCRNLTTAEVQMHLSGATMFVIPLAQQPSDKVDVNTWGFSALTPKHHIEMRGYFASCSMEHTSSGFYRPDSSREYGSKFYKIPFQPGQVIYGRESWYNESDHCERIAPVYKASNADWVMVSGGKWLSSASMPKLASRIFQRIDKIEVVRVQDVTEEQAKNFGLDIKSCPVGYIPSYQKEPHAYTFCHYYTTRFGLESWERNDWIWLFTYTALNSLNG